MRSVIKTTVSVKYSAVSTIFTILKKIFGQDIQELPKQCPQILLVDDVEANLFVLKSLLSKFDAELIEVNSGPKALLQAVRLDRLALILLDVQMPEMDGYEVAQLLKEEEQTKDIPIIFVTAIHRDDEQVLKGYSFGAADYLTKPIIPEILLSKVGVFLDLWQLRAGLQQEIEKRTSVEERLRHLAHHDELTGLPNRRELMNAFEREINRANRFNKRFFILMIDLDGFKHVNDQYGHEAGDFTLLEVSARITKLIRQYDSFARIGGDEFVIIMSDIEEKVDVERKVKQVIKEVSRKINHEQNSFQIGASVGIASYPNDGNDIDTLLANADNAMYSAKRAGGSQLTHHSNSIPSK